MKKTLNDLQDLKDIKFNFNDYGMLPERADIYTFAKAQKDKEPLLEQWKKLNYLRKHLRILDKYIKTNKGKTLNNWLRINDEGLSETVLKKLGSYNNETGGISAYFLNLQKFYDEEEEIYDELEKKSLVPDYLKKEISKFQIKRSDKRETRKKARKLKFKDLKKDEKGYLFVKLEKEPMPNEKTEKAEGEKQNEKPKEKDEKKTDEKADENPEEKIKKSVKNIGIWICGITITLAVVSVVVGFSLQKNTK